MLDGLGPLQHEGRGYLNTIQSCFETLGRVGVRVGVRYKGEGILKGGIGGGGILRGLLYGGCVYMEGGVY